MILWDASSENPLSSKKDCTASMHVALAWEDFDDTHWTLVALAFSRVEEEAGDGLWTGLEGPETMTVLAKTGLLE